MNTNQILVNIGDKVTNSVLGIGTVIRTRYDGLQFIVKYDNFDYSTWGSMHNANITHLNGITFTV